MEGSSSNIAELLVLLAVGLIRDSKLHGVMVYTDMLIMKTGMLSWMRLEDWTNI